MYSANQIKESTETIGIFRDELHETKQLVINLINSLEEYKNELPFIATDLANLNKAKAFVRRLDDLLNEKHTYEENTI